MTAICRKYLMVVVYVCVCGGTRVWDYGDLGGALSPCQTRCQSAACTTGEGGVMAPPLA